MLFGQRSFVKLAKVWPQYTLLLPFVFSLSVLLLLACLLSVFFQSILIKLKLFEVTKEKTMWVDAQVGSLQLNAPVDNFILLKLPSQST